MITTNFSEFRKHAAEFLDEVEKGEVVRILRHGKAVADIRPVLADDKPSWKKKPPQIPLSGVSLSKAILGNRKDAPK
jgi:prevent-host-death family protein